MSDEERVLSWLEDNYKGLILGIIIGISILFGYKLLLSDRNTTQLFLSQEFDIAVNAYENGKSDIILKFSDANIIDNPSNIYTNLSNLYSARIMYEQNNINEAYKYFDHIIKNSKDIDVKNIAIYRKSKILIEQKKFSEAHSLLGNKLKNYQHIELKGDLYLLQKDYDNAIINYKDVLTYALTPNERKNILSKINLIK